MPNKEIPDWLKEAAEEFGIKIQTRPGTAARLNAVEWFIAGVTSPEAIRYHQSAAAESIAIPLPDKSREVNFHQVVPDSHFWTSLEMLINYCSYQSTAINREYLLKGLENTLKNGYDIQPINTVKQDGLEAIAFAEWLGDYDNPFLLRQDGRWMQACGNSTSWSTKELYEIFIKAQPAGAKPIIE